MRSAISRVVRTAIALVPAVLVTWSVAIVVHAVEGRWAGAMPFAFMAGSDGLVLWLGLALAVAPLAVLLEHPPQSARFDRVEWLACAGMGCCALLAFVPLRMAAPAFLPTTLAFLPELAFAVAVYGACALAALIAWVAWRTRLRERPFPLWIIAPIYMVARTLAAEPLRIVAPGREHILDAALFAVLVASALSIAPRLPRFVLIGVTSAWVTAVLALLVLFSHQPAARAGFVSAYPGAAALVAGLRGWVDADGDGFSAWLAGGDCDDLDPRVHPLAFEIIGNGIDENCIAGDLTAFTEPAPAHVLAGAERRSIVVITADTVRADMLNAQNMPRLTELAARSATFTRAYASAPYTTGSMRSFMTGQPAMSMSIQWQRDLGADPSIAARLRSAGFDTSVVLYRWWAKGDSWIASEGLQNVVTVEPPKGMSELTVTGPLITPRALGELERLVAADKPFFLWIHYLDAHAEYIPRADTPFSGKRDARSRYAQEVWSTDREIGRIANALERHQFFDRGILLVHSDHGELIDDHGRTGHAFWLDEDVLRTVVVLHGADIPVGRYDTRIGMIDLAPTLLRMAAGISVSTAGQDLAPILNGRERADRDVLVYSSYETTRQGALLSGSYKLVQDYVQGIAFLYDLKRDPEEQRNLIEVDAERARQLKLRYAHAWDASINDAVWARHARVTVEGMCARGDQKACAALAP